MQILEHKMEAIMPFIKEQIESGVMSKLIVTGTSMTPMLRSGKDSVLLKEVETLKKGDIILYKRQNGRYVLHRIIGVKEDFFLCCGDNQWRKEIVYPHQVEAVACAYYRTHKKKELKGFGYWCYIDHLPLRRLYRRLREALSRIIKRTRN